MPERRRVLAQSTHSRVVNADERGLCRTARDGHPDVQGDGSVQEPDHTRATPFSERYIHIDPFRIRVDVPRQDVEITVFSIFLCRREVIGGEAATSGNEHQGQ